ncbi:MAG: protein translocase subunit SecD [Pseudomonadota bacterium]
MLQFSRWQTIAIIGAILLGAWFAVPNFFSDEQRAAWPGFMPKSQINLGLDLQGGSYLLVGVDSDDVIAQRLKSLRQEIQRELRPNRTAGRERVRVSGGRVALNEETGLISFTVENAEQVAEAAKRVRDVTRQSVGGVPGLGLRPYEVTTAGARIDVAMTPDARAYYKRDALTTSMTVIRRRIDPAGNKEVSIQPQGDARIVIQVPGDDDPERLKRLLGGTGQLSFHRHDPTVDLQDADAGLLPPGRIYVPYAETEDLVGSMVLYEDAVITGDMVTSASAGLNNESGGFQINFSFDGRGARRFGDYTRDHIGELFAIVLDNEIISAPRIQSAITAGNGRITGNFTPEEAQRIATLIQAGALPAELQILEQRSVGPELGAESVRAGSLALIVGFIGVVIYMVLSYGRFGIYADLALIANVILIAGALSLFGSTLTLPGIAGIVLTIGMAVDANVLIFERIREEILNGKGPINAVETGYSRAWSAILDANVTTFLAALIMFQLGAGPVRGFAVTLAVGVVTSVFTAFVLTRMFAGGWLLSARPKTIKL